MEHKHAIVVDRHGYRHEFVLAEIDVERKLERPLYYDLQEGERLIFEGVQEALGMYRARWTNTGWIDCASEEEIAAIEEARREELGLEDAGAIPADPRDLALAELTELVVENQIKMDLALAEIAEMI